MEYTAFQLRCIFYIMYVCDGPLEAALGVPLNAQTILGGLLKLRGHHACPT